MFFNWQWLFFWWCVSSPVGIIICINKSQNNGIKTFVLGFQFYFLNIYGFRFWAKWGMYWYFVIYFPRLTDYFVVHQFIPSFSLFTVTAVSVSLYYKLIYKLIRFIFISLMPLNQHLFLFVCIWRSIYMNSGAGGGRGNCYLLDMLWSKGVCLFVHYKTAYKIRLMNHNRV